MCRLAAFPPNFPRDEAKDILLNMLKKNTDGFGYTYLKSPRRFHLVRYPGSIEDIIDHEETLGHMPHNGWTIAHMRLATQGGNFDRNTHPFIKGEWAVVHNGMFGNSDRLRLALEVGGARFAGETDTEVASTFIARMGPKWFSHKFNWEGVYLCLNKDGHLYAVNTQSSGDLKAHGMGGTVLLSSELDMTKYKSEHLTTGWYKFSKEGELIDADQFIYKTQETKGANK